MDIANNIRNWLNGKQNKEEGIELLKLVNPSIHVAVVKFPHRYSTTKIAGYLIQYLNAPISQTKTSVNKPKKEKNIDTIQVSDAVIKAQNQARKLYKELMNKRAILFNLCKLDHTNFENEGSIVQKRGILASEIVELRYKVDEAYKAIEYAKEHNKLPEQITIQVPPEDLHRQISNLQKSLSTDRRHKDSNSIKIQERILKKEALLKSLKAQYDRLFHTK